MQTVNITMPAGMCGLAIQAFSEIKGQMPILGAYKKGKILEEMDRVRQLVGERITPRMNAMHEAAQEAENTRAETEERDAVKVQATPQALDEDPEIKAVLEEEMQLTIPHLTLFELGNATCTDASALTFLEKHGLLQTDAV
jgi:hypothetical protein